MHIAFHRALPIAAIIVLFPCLIRGQEARYRVEPVVSREGFSRTTVYAMLQDRYGFLWFGTRNGLVKYDGYGTRRYICGKSPTAIEIPDCTVISVAEDSTGYIWAGTQDGGLIRLDRRTGALRIFRHDRDDSSSLNPGSVISIVVDSRGWIWIVTRFGFSGLDCLARYDPSTGLFTRYDISRAGGVPAETYITPYIDRQGGLWVCSNTLRSSSRHDHIGYLSRYDVDRDVFTTRLTLSIEQPLRIIGERGDGKLAIITTGSGGPTLPLVQLFDPKGGVSVYLDVPMRRMLRRADQIFAVQFDRDGKCWYTVSSSSGPTYSAGRATLYCETMLPFDSLRSRASGTPVVSRPILVGGVVGLLTDRSGVRWAATEEGVVKISDISTGFITWRHDPNDSSTLSAPRIRSVWIDRTGILWAGTDLGLNRYDRATDRWQRYFWKPDDSRSLPNSIINTIYEDRRGTLWLGTRKGLAVYDRSADHFTPAPLTGISSLDLTGPWAVLNDRQGRTWIGDRHGLFLFDSTGALIRLFDKRLSAARDIPSHDIWSLLEDRNGTIWIGTNEGLFRWLPESESFRRYVHQPGNPQSIGGDRIWALYEDRSARLWICSYGGGISRYDPIGDDFTTTTTRDGLPNNKVFGLLEDNQGIFWISTIDGLVSWNRQTNAFRVYDRNDGLQGDEFSFKAFFKAADGTLYFGGTEGLTAFKPEALRQNGSVPRIVITGFYVFDSLAASEVVDSDTIRLEYDRNFFSFNFAALDYVNPGRNLYSYMLEGVDPDWVHVGSDHRVASYTDVAPGIYTFHVRGSNNDGAWNQRGISVTIIIAPPWWATWWCYMLAATAATMLALTGIGLRTNGIRRVEREKQQGAVKAALESQEAERQRIARELHDGVGQMLAAAGVNLSYASEILKRKPGGIDSDISASLTRSLSILGRASADVRAISHALGTISLHDLGLVAAIGELLGSLDPHQRTRFEFETMGMDERLPDHLETGLFRVAQELIANVLRHAEATEATVQIVRENGEIRLTVEDNGIGFDPNHTNGGMGRRNVAARVSVMNGRVKYDVSPGHGATVMVTVHHVN